MSRSLTAEIEAMFADFVRAPPQRMWSGASIAFA